ncbi:MAG: ATP-binding protein, partial [Deltaproteobacteria bacterium]|nr:ATP-binding protein [Deltaproteobacteria bacterium]
MSFLNKPIESISETDLQTLKENQVAEGKTVEYKAALPGGTDSGKKEFLADVSSFANASGGHLLFGIEEANGIPTAIPGLDIPDTDALINRLENIVRDGIEPRIPGIQMRKIDLKTSKKVIIISIPKSWSLPHMVIFQGHSKFYSRNSSGKYPLDVGELRSAFLLSETTIERIRRFRLERLGKILSGETPVPVELVPKMVLHLIPINAFDPARKLDPKFIFEQTKDI